MADKTYRVFGRVIDRKTRRSLSGLRVETWDKDTKYHDMLGVAVTNAEGRFQIAFDETYFGDYARDRLPDLFFKVFRGDTLIKSTEDSVLWNVVVADTEVTIEVDLPAVKPIGKDRVTTAQAIKGVEFMRKSDFRGLWNETTDKATTLGGFVADMVKASVAKMDLSPVKPSGIRTRAIINQDVVTAQRNLEAKQVVVNEVRPYEPELNAQSVATVTAFPLRLKPGDKVNLYEENGRVRYYSIVKERAPADINAADVARLDNEVGSIRSKLRELDTVKAELATVRASSEASKSELTEEVKSVKTQLAAFDEVKKDLETMKQQSTQKDQQIGALQKDVESLRTRHNDFVAEIPPGKIAQMEQDIQKLQEFIAKVEKTPKRRRKPPPE